MEDEIRRLLAEGAILDAKSLIAQWARQVRAGKGGEEAMRIADAMIPYFVHESPRIRQAVAEIADVYPESAFEHALTTFSKDPNGYVRAGIEHAAKVRARQRKVRAKEVVHEKRVADVVSEIEARHGKGARRLADRAVRRGTEYFVRKLHHEASKIATPLDYALTRIRSELARPSPDVSVLQENLALATTSQRHMQTILDRSREATATVVPCFADESLLTLVQEARAHLEARLGDRSARLAFEVDVAYGLRFDADRSAFLQALQNFFQNAAEAYPADATSLPLIVGARSLRLGSEVELTITDRGPGMNEEQLAGLFVPFNSSKSSGTGLGLLVARTMIEEVHNGTLALESTVGVGTTVRILVPSQQAGYRKRQKP